jgi:alpha-galactosidase
VQLNARAGRPMNISGHEYSRGLYCHARSEVLVRLPGPGASFTAVAGVDSNDQTSNGRGSVHFAVAIGEEAVFRSPLLQEGMPPLSVEVDLKGADQLRLLVEDGGDGISCDQADWAEARVRLADGRQIWLGELPLFDGPGPALPSIEPPYAFEYGGRPSAEFLDQWPVERSSRDLDSDRRQHVVIHRDPASGLVVRCEAIEYLDFPIVEWTVYFRNNGPNDTPILANIQSLDEVFPVGGQGQFLLRHFRGSPCTARDYEPLQTPLPPGEEKRISAAGGRPTNSDMPYFNLDEGDHGFIIAVGWPGQWAAQFEAVADGGIRVIAGQETTHVTLHPGEEIRTPLMVLQHWRGDWIDAQNIWRRWMIAHNLPRPGGAVPRLQMAACSSHQFGEMIHADSASQILFIDRYLEERLPLDYWWMDAGWYPCDGQWPKTGTWEVDQTRFPGGLRPISDHAHERGVKTIVWFEPERVHRGTWLTEEHPDWVLGGEGGGLLNLGDPVVLNWLTKHVDQLITEQGIDLYRQDFNMDPLGFWQANDAPDRRGMTENRHVTAYLAYWDELRRRHPEMLIDTCASGGRRNDLETLRRAVPLLRSDYIMEPVGNQGHTYGMSFWIPFQGTGSGSRELSPYLLRSTMVNHFTACFDVRDHDLDYDMIRRVVGQWRDYGFNYMGDYYPLTDYNLDPQLWIAWQFDRPEEGKGMVQAFRRDRSPYEAARFKLRGLDSEADYLVRNLDTNETQSHSGRALMEIGLAVTIPLQPGDAVLTYSRQ